MEILVTFIVIVVAVIYFASKGTSAGGSGDCGMDYWMWKEFHDHHDDF